jgi:hypothetical protein
MDLLPVVDVGCRTPVLVHRGILATRIGEAPMPSQRRGSRSRQPQVVQFSLFDNQPVGPQWRQLPPATRSAVTELMVQLLSEHRRSERLYVAGERSDD